MNSEPVHPSDLTIIEPAAVAGRAVFAWDWYYSFTEACLVMREVVHH